MVVNDQFFVPPLKNETYLAARGFDPKSGVRSGGIIAPVMVELPAGAVLFRFYHDARGEYGQWWATPRELSLIVQHFGRGVGAFDVGRSRGKGILQGTLAVRHDWAGNSPLHMGTFIVAALQKPLKAYFGEGDHAPDSSQTQIQKTVMIIDDTGRQRPARQIFLPRAWEYQADLRRIGGGTGEQPLLQAIEAHKTRRLAFE